MHRCRRRTSADAAQAPERRREGDVGPPQGGGRAGVRSGEGGPRLPAFPASQPVFSPGGVVAGVYGAQSAEALPVHAAGACLRQRLRGQGAQSAAERPGGVRGPAPLHPARLMIDHIFPPTPTALASRLDPSISVVRRPSSVARRPSSVVRHPSSGIRHPASGIRHPASGDRRTAADNRLPAYAVSGLSETPRTPAATPRRGSPENAALSRGPDSQGGRCWTGDLRAWRSRS